MIFSADPNENSFSIEWQKNQPSSMWTRVRAQYALNRRFLAEIDPNLPQFQGKYWKFSKDWPEMYGHIWAKNSR